MNGYYIIYALILGLGVVFILWADYRQAIKLRELCRKDTNHEDIKKILSLIAYSGPYTLREIRRIKKLINHTQ